MNPRISIQGLVLAALVFVSGCHSALQGGLEESAANEMLLVLAEAGVAGRKERSGSGDRTWTVIVPEDELSLAWRVLHGAGLPRTRHAGFRTVYAERGLVPGRLEERALFLSAMQEEIAETLESVEGVVSARVHAAVRAERSGYRRLGENADRPDPTAAVLIVYLPGPDGVPPLSEEEVKKIVTNAVDGLEPGRVAVVFTPRRPVRLPGQDSDRGGSASSGPMRLASVVIAALALLSGLVVLLVRRGWLGELLSRRRV